MVRPNNKCLDDLFKGRNNENWKSEVLDDEDVMDVSDFSVYYDVKTNQVSNIISRYRVILIFMPIVADQSLVIDPDLGLQQ